MKQKLISEKTAQRTSRIMKIVGEISLIAIVAYVAFLSGYYYPKIKQVVSEDKKTLSPPKNPGQITISFTDRGELMMMSRETGKFEIYDESVGLNVFKAYGSRIIQTQTK